MALSNNELIVGNPVKDYAGRIVTIKAINVTEFNFVEVEENGCRYDTEDLYPILSDQ